VLKCGLREKLQKSGVMLCTLKRVILLVSFFGAGIAAVFLFSVKGHKFLFANWAFFIQIVSLPYYCSIRLKSFSKNSLQPLMLEYFLL